jgi:hypothetical protein
LDFDSCRAVDLGIYADGSDRDAWVNVRDRLHARLGGLPGRVDLWILKDAPATFLDHVLRGRLIDLRDEELYRTVFEETARVCLDMEPILRRAAREAFGQ